MWMVVSNREFCYSSLDRSHIRSRRFFFLFGFCAGKYAAAGSLDGFLSFMGSP